MFNKPGWMGLHNREGGAWGWDQWGNWAAGQPSQVTVLVLSLVSSLQVRQKSCYLRWYLRVRA
jgi:hypothetical protein